MRLVIRYDYWINYGNYHGDGLSDTALTFGDAVFGDDLRAGFDAKSMEIASSELVEVL